MNDPFSEELKKKIRNLNKKLNKIQEVKDKAQNGNFVLNDDQKLMLQKENLILKQLEQIQKIHHKSNQYSQLLKSYKAKRTIKQQQIFQTIVYDFQNLILKESSILKQQEGTFEWKKERDDFIQLFQKKKQSKKKDEIGIEEESNEDDQIIIQKPVTKIDHFSYDFENQYYNKYAQKKIKKVDYLTSPYVQKLKRQEEIDLKQPDSGAKNDNDAEQKFDLNSTNLDVKEILRNLDKCKKNMKKTYDQRYLPQQLTSQIKNSKQNATHQEIRKNLYEQVLHWLSWFGGKSLKFESQLVVGRIIQMYHYKDQYIQYNFTNIFHGGQIVEIVDKLFTKFKNSKNDYYKAISGLEIYHPQYQQL